MITHTGTEARKLVTIPLDRLKKSLKNVRKTPHTKAEIASLADHVTREIGLDMTAYWQPTASSYLGRVSKDRILQALRESAVANIDAVAALKKQAMAEAAAAALAGKGWLPPALRVPAQIAA